MKETYNLSALQKEKLSRLEFRLKSKIRERDLKSTKIITKDIQDLLKPLGQFNRLAQIKNRMFELAMDINEYDFAEQGFIGNRKMVNSNTRTYLESTALLAICYLRKNEFEKAKPYIKEVLQNQKVIRTEWTRRNFRKEIIQRFDEESVLFSLKDGNIDEFNIDEIQSEASSIIATKNEDDIYFGSCLKVG